jgi:hypothetical protein
MAFNWYPASSLTGGGEGALDAIDGADLLNGYRAYVITDALVYFYILDETSGAAANAPFVIPPVNNAGDKRWILICFVNKNLMFTSNSDGSHTPNAIDSIEGSNDIILAGSNNSIKATISGAVNAIYNGIGNLITGNSQKNAIAGGGANIIGNLKRAVRNSIVLGGQRNIIGGSFNTYMYDAACLGGKYNEIIDSDQACILGGGYNRTIKAYESAIVGSNGEAFIPTQFVVSGGSGGSSVIEFKGQHQSSWINMAGKTTSATETEFWVRYGYSSATRIKLKMQKVLRFVITVSAMQVEGAAGTIGDSAFWEITGAIKNVGGKVAKSTMEPAYFPPGSEPSFIGDSFTINDVTYTWSENPTEPTDIPIPTASYESSNFAVSAINEYKPSGILKATSSSSYVYLESLPHLGDEPNSWTFSETGTHMNMDGSGNFGGTQAGSAGTLSFVGAPQGGGVPAADNRDAGAAAWEVNIYADDVNKALVVKGTGEADKTIRWTAKVALTEVS